MGADADVADRVTEENLEDSIRFVKHFAKESGSIVAVTGAIDLVSDGETCYVIRNGRPEMGKITGTGCQSAWHDDGGFSWQPIRKISWKQQRQQFA